jgi:rod shape-determining protein MreB
MFDDALGRLSVEIAVDLGTANTRIFVAGKGLAAELPSVVAVEQGGAGRQVVAVGDEARRMLGRTPDHISALRPLRGGVVEDYALVQHLLDQGLRVAAAGRSWRGMRMLLCVPHHTEEVARRALQDAARAVGARQVELIAKSAAAAVGADLPVQRPTASVVVDLGAGVTEIAVISLGALIDVESVRGGGALLDEGIAAQVQELHQVMIGDRTAEQLKTQLASALPRLVDLEGVVTGRDLRTGIPREVTVSGASLVPAVQGVLGDVLSGLRRVLGRLSPELAADVSENGIVLTGGGARLKGVDAWLGEQTGLAVVSAEDPERATILGAGALLGAGHRARLLL